MYCDVGVTVEEESCGGLLGEEFSGEELAEVGGRLGDELLDKGGEEKLLSELSSLSILSLKSMLLSMLEEEPSSLAQAIKRALGDNRQSAITNAANEFLLFIIFSPFSMNFAVSKNCYRSL